MRSTRTRAVGVTVVALVAANCRSDEEAGGSADWCIYSALVRKGSVLALIQVVDIRAGEGVELHYSMNDIGPMMQTAVDKH